MSRTRGAQGEDVAARWLRRRGWAVLHRNWRAPGGEIDLVARRAGVVAVVEVKTRSRAGDPEHVHAAQATRVRRAALAYLARHPPPPGSAVRLDLITVTGRWPLRRVRLLPGALEDPPVARTDPPRAPRRTPRMRPS